MSIRFPPAASLSIFFTIALFIFNFEACASSSLRVDINHPVYALGKHVAYIEDKSGQMDVDAIRKMPVAAWKDNTSIIPNFGFSESVYWFRVTLETSKEQKRLLEVAYPLLDDISLYQFIGERLAYEEQSGDILPFHARILKFSGFIFPIMLTGAEQSALYLRVKTAGTMQVPLSLWSESAFNQHDGSETAVLGIYFGIIIVMALYNLFIYLRLREPAYLFYVLYVISFGLFMAGLFGWGYKYIWPEATNFQQYNPAVFIIFSGIFVCRFIHYFLDLSNKSPRVGQVLLGVAYTLFFLLCLLPFTSYFTIIQMTLPLIFVMAATALYSGFLLWLQGDVAARYFTIAWVTFLSAIFLAILEKFGFLPLSFWTESFLPVGMALEVILLSLALGERINTEKLQRIYAQEEVIRVQEKSKFELEQKVIERTAELENANERLHLLATTDGLTNICNRRHFLERAEHALNIAKRYQRTIAIIMLDVDFFKAVNDNYGHEAGDKVLQHLVAVCSGVYRETDIFGRLGGEEFATLLFEASSPEAALVVAERLRVAVESSPLEYAGESISVTVSQGVCAVEPSQPYPTITQMLKVADDALYQAKQTGRNRVVMLPSKA